MVETTFDSSLEIIAKLVKDFRASEAHHLSPEYSEAQVRKDYIDNFWTALGWDVNHVMQRNPYEQEVKVELSQRHGNYNKHADYAFSLAPNFRDTLFIVEAKKPAKNLRDADCCYQAVRYGYNAGNPFVLLHDFEQLLVLNSTRKPNVETASAQVVAEWHYTQLPDKEQFAKIYYWFSREAVAQGSLQKRANEIVAPKGRSAMQKKLFKTSYQTVDEDFLADLEAQRESLAKAFKKTSPQLDGVALTEIVQRVLDRLIFIRFLEDRGIENKSHIEEIIQSSNPWKTFTTRVTALDRIYNGIVFKALPSLDMGTPPDEDDFADIVQAYAPKESEYDFNHIPIHILGSIYERFLGKIIVTTEKRAHVEDKPEVRNAGGVYYTPEYIVRYIVEKTIGVLVEGKTPAQVAKLKFGDVACGSGSFLLGAYDYLLRWHARYYNEHPDEAKKGELTQTEDGGYVLTLRKRQSILTNNIFGVDVDSQAVEVAQVSLYLRLLQDETAFTAKSFQIEFHTPMLPPLTDNIVHGNSLIGTDIIHEEFSFNAEELRKMNPMDFPSAFKEIFKKGGRFDAVIGNPPYGAYLYEKDKAYLKSHYQHQTYQLDTYLLFLERSIWDLLGKGGLFGMIIPNPWLTNLMQDGMRRFVVSNTRIREIVHFKFKVFPDATVDTEIVLLEKDNPDKWKAQVRVVNSLDNFTTPTIGSAVTQIIHDQDKWRALNGAVINIFSSPAEEALAAKIKRVGKPLEFYFNINVGIKPYQTGKGAPPQTKKIVDARPFDSDTKLSTDYLQYLRGSDIGRYFIRPVEVRYIKYGEWLAEPRPAARFGAAEKIFMRQTGDSLVGCYDPDQLLCLNNMHVLVPKSASPHILYFLGLINSKLLNWYYHMLNPEVGEALAEVKKTNVAQLPVVAVGPNGNAKPLHHDQMVELVTKLIDARKKLDFVKTEADKTVWERLCASLEDKIDVLVFKIYDLTADDINLVDPSGK